MKLKDLIVVDIGNLLNLVDKYYGFINDYSERLVNTARGRIQISGVNFTQEI